MSVIVNGNINANSVLAPDVYVQIMPPSDVIAQGLPTNIVRCVGVASWGPKNSPTDVGDINDYVQKFGPVLNSSVFDMGTFVAVASQKFVNTFKCVRVTDGTDVAASVAILDTVPATGLTLTALYSGTVGNTISVNISAGSNSSTASPTYKVSIGLPNNIPEVFDNIGGSGAALWAAMRDAINNGQSGVRGPSQLVVATVGTATAAPALSTYTLSGGANGNSTVTAATLVGSDTGARTGMYALRNTGIGVTALVGCTDSTTFATQATFGEQEGQYMIAVGPVGETPAQSKTVKQTLGLTSFAFKLLVGDWEYWYDSTNQQTRLVTPQASVCSVLSSLLPSESGLNKQISNIIGTQKTYANQVYSKADIVTMMQAGIDVISSPSPGGSYFAQQTGKNTSGNILQSDDSYTRLTFFIAYSLNAVLGGFIGQLQTPTVRQQARNTIQTFLQNLQNEGIIGDVNGGSAYQVILDESNNPSSQVALGIMQAQVKVVTFKVIYVFLVNLQTGEVSLSSTSANNQ